MNERGGIQSVGTRRLRSLQIGIGLFGDGSGGLDRMFSELVRTLPDVGIDVGGGVMTPPNAATLTEGRIHSFAGAKATLPRRLLGARNTISELIRTGHYDLVVAHFALFLAVAQDRLRGLPLVVHFHGPWAEESRKEGVPNALVIAKYLIERRVYHRADRVIVLSRAFGQLLSDSYGVPADRIRIVEGCVDLARFRATMSRDEARRQLGWPTGRPILLSVRRLANRMGLDRLLEAMVAVSQAVPDVVLHVAGRGYLAEKLQQQAVALGLERNVRFVGFVSESDLPLALRAADVNVLPTIALEGFGLSAAEGLAAGTPALVTPVGGLPEVVAELSTTQIFASAEVGDLAQGLVEALRGIRRLPDEASCARFAAERFGVQRAAARTADVYREIA